MAAHHFKHKHTTRPPSTQRTLEGEPAAPEGWHLPLKFSQINEQVRGLSRHSFSKRTVGHGLMVDLDGRILGIRCGCGSLQWPDPAFQDDHKGRCNCGRWLCPALAYVNGGEY